MTADARTLAAVVIDARIAVRQHRTEPRRPLPIALHTIWQQEYHAARERDRRAAQRSMAHGS